MTISFVPSSFFFLEEKIPFSLLPKNLSQRPLTPLMRDSSSVLVLVERDSAIEREVGRTNVPLKQTRRGLDYPGTPRRGEWVGIVPPTCTSYQRGNL
ncbi:hypothetical protein J6590_035320 [Homalodisca vitripennis]|nr:hypothetical protein J6590_035320 [Homalodisca vitripennis]